MIIKKLRCRDGKVSTMKRANTTRVNEYNEDMYKHDRTTSYIQEAEVSSKEMRDVSDNHEEAPCLRSRSLVLAPGPNRSWKLINSSISSSISRMVADVDSLVKAGGTAGAATAPFSVCWGADIRLEDGSSTVMTTSSSGSPAAGGAS